MGGMPRIFATSSITSCDSQPFSSCAMASAAITADCFWSAGYLAISRSIFLRACSESSMVVSGWDAVMASAVDLAEHDVLRADNRDGIGDHVTARHLVQRLQVGKARGPYLQP